MQPLGDACSSAAGVPDVRLSASTSRVGEVSAAKAASRTGNRTQSRFALCLDNRAPALDPRCMTYCRACAVASQGRRRHRHCSPSEARNARPRPRRPSRQAQFAARERVVGIDQGWKQSRAINNSLRSPGSLEYLLPRPSVEEIIIMLLKGLRGECRHEIKGPASQAAGARYVRPLCPCP